MAEGRQKLIKRLRGAVDDQGRNWEKFFKLVNKHYREHHDPAKAETVEKPSTPERKEFVADMMRAWNRPWGMWETELQKRIELQNSNRKRQAGIVSSNDARRRRAEGNYQLYRGIAEKLIATNPALGGKSRHRLAQLVQLELRKRRGQIVSTRTIWEALGPKNKA